MAKSRLVELEKKIDVVMKGLNILLFEEGEALPQKEVEEVKARLEDYLKRRRSAFVKLNESHRIV